MNRPLPFNNGGEFVKYVKIIRMLNYRVFVVQSRFITYLIDRNVL